MHQQHTGLRAVLALVVCCAWTSLVHAAEKAGDKAAGKVPNKSVEKAAPAKQKAPTYKPTDTAAIVNGQKVEVGEVFLMIESVLPGRKLPPEQLPKIYADVLNQLIERRLVQALIKEEGTAVDPAQVAQKVKQLSEQLSRAKMTLSKALEERNTTEAALREQFGWQIVWEEYLRTHLNNTALEAYFKANHRLYDGTQLRASHILLRPAGSNDPKEYEALVKQAEALRERISRRKIAFDDAARQFSAGPSRKNGGDIGYFPRFGLMEEPFSKAAFALQKDDISPPVSTSFGVHLILITDIKPGEGDWTQMRDRLKGPASLELFEQLSKKARVDAKVEYTAFPHYKLGTKELVLGSSEG